MIHPQRHDLRFSMPCPYDDPVTEARCGVTIQVRAWPGTPRTYDDPGDDPGWEAWGCLHVEGTVTEQVEWAIQQKVEEKEEDARSRVEEARIAQAEAAMLVNRPRGQRWMPVVALRVCKSVFIAL